MKEEFQVKMASVAESGTVLIHPALSKNLRKDNLFIKTTEFTMVKAVTSHK